MQKIKKIKEMTPIEAYKLSLLTEKELARISPDDYDDLMYSEKAEYEKTIELNNNLGVEIYKGKI